VIYDRGEMKGSRRRGFRVKVRPGRAIVTATTDPGFEPPTSARAGQDVVVSEETAAFLVRQRAADVVEVIPEGDAESSRRSA
jgi:hypothetical protein